MTSFYTEEELKGLGFRHIGNGVCISRKASIYGAQNISLGDHVRIDDFCIYTALYGGSDGIFIEDFANLSSRICVYSVSDDYSGQTMTNPMVPDEYKAVESAPVHIRRHVIVGSTSVILPGVDLKEGSAFGSFSFINHDPEPWSMNAGIPAHKIKERSRNLLELEKQFTALYKSKSPAEPVA